MARLPTTLALLAVTAALAGCGGGSDDSSVTFLDTQSTPAMTTTVAPPTTETTPATETQTTTTPADTGGAPATTSTPADTGGATVTQDDESGADTGGTTIPRTRAPAAAPRSRRTPTAGPGPVPGHPDRPQCEPLSGPDARDDDG